MHLYFDYDMSLQVACGVSQMWTNQSVHKFYNSVFGTFQMSYFQGSDVQSAE